MSASALPEQQPVVVTVKSVRRTFLDFVDVVDDNDEDAVEAGAEKLAACTWPVCSLRRPSVASDDTTDDERPGEHQEEEADPEARSGPESDAEEQCDSEADEQHIAEAEAAQVTENPPVAEEEQEEAEEEAEEALVTEGTLGAERRSAPFISLPSGSRVGTECVSPLIDTSPLVDAEEYSPMWSWHNHVASFYNCATPGLAMPSLLGTTEPLQVRPVQQQPMQVRPVLQEPRFIPRPSVSAASLASLAPAALAPAPAPAGPAAAAAARGRWTHRDSAFVEPAAAARERWTHRDSAYVEPSAALAQRWTSRDSAYVEPSAALSQAGCQMAAAASLPRLQQPRPTKRQQRQQQQLLQQRQLQLQQQQQLQIQRADPNRLERRRHPAKKRDGDADAGMLDASGAHTTIMIRNLPNNYTRDMLLQLLRSCGFATKCDFVYLPIDFHTQSNLGYAFVNLEDHSEARHFWQVFDGFDRWAVRSKKVASLRWSECQGLEANVKRYRNSPVMGETVPSDHKPVVFVGGVQVEFPAPTKLLRAPRIKQFGFK